MREASKTNLVRDAGFASSYLQGSVLDIGAGSDPVCPGAVVFDQQDGDANDIERYFAFQSFDTVHSSHCLEHMDDPIRALSKWWALVKPEGFMVIVVPDEALYEQGRWPSVFNSDHKSSFRLDNPVPLSAVSFDIGELCRTLPNAVIVHAVVQDDELDRTLLLPAGTTSRRIRQPLKFAVSIMKRVTSAQGKPRARFNRWLVRRGYPFDQTKGAALAQIQIVLRKQHGVEPALPERTLAAVQH
jgi:predicted SAM-dependent methyltransferase